MKRGLLFYSKVSKSGVVGCKRREWRQVPRTEQEQERIIRACHSSVEGRQESFKKSYTARLQNYVSLVGGHLGRDKTYYKIAERFYWKTLWTDVQQHVQQCETCQTTNDAKFEKAAAPLHPIPVKSKVWNQVINVLVFHHTDVLATYCKAYI